MINKVMERKKSNSSQDMADVYRSLPLRDSENNNGAVSHNPCPLLSRPSKLNFASNLRCITEKSEGSGNFEQVDNDWEIEKDLTEEVFSRSGSDTSSLISSPCTPYNLRNFSQLSSESVDDVDFEKSEPILPPSSQDPDIMAARRSSMRNRRSGFAFHFGDQAVPANAFVNTEVDPQAPKMLSVTEMMMKINSEKKPNDSSSILPPKESSPKGYEYPILDPQRKESLRKAGAGPQRFSLIGLRKVSSSEIEEDLGFLHCLGDRGLHLSMYEHIVLLWFDRRGRFVAGLIVGIALAVFIRLMLVITDYFNRS